MPTRLRQVFKGHSLTLYYASENFPNNKTNVIFIFICKYSEGTTIHVLRKANT